MDGPRQHDAGLRRAGRERRQTDRDAADIEGMKPVDVLVRIDRRDHHVRTDLRRQRKLNQNAVYLAIAVEPFEQRQQLGLARRCRQPMVGRPHAGFGGHLLLGADIDLARGIVADQHHREAGNDAMAVGEATDSLHHARAQFGRDGLAVDHGRCHGAASMMRARAAAIAPESPAM
jgi:hypothetical protein